MTWNKIDLWPEGPAGVEAKWRRDGETVYCYIYGSDHVLDWLHHFLPRAKLREIIAGDVIALKLAEIVKDKDVRIGGHSLGGAIAGVVADTLVNGQEFDPKHVSLFTFGAKRCPWKCIPFGTHYRHRGDAVPFLPPWRPAYKLMQVFGKWSFPWKAHGPATYYDAMSMHGFR